METWKDIPTFEGRYQISTFGRVRNKKTSYILKSNSKGTPCVPFVINNHTNVFEIQYLMCVTWLGWDIYDTFHPVIIHKDEDFKNNSLSNLEIEYSSSLQKGVFRHLVSVKCCKDDKSFSSMQECAEFCGISYS